MQELEKIKRLEFHEGFKANPYKCTANKLTQGIGRNIEDNPLSETEKLLIRDLNNWTLAEARTILKGDIKVCETLLSNLCRCYDKLDDERQYALLDMCYQLGINGLLGFKKMLRALEVGDFEYAATQCLDSKYAKKDTPSRANRIARLIKTGVWTI